MTLQEVLDMIQLKYPHGYTNVQVVTMINDIQRRIFRTLYKQETTTTYDLIGGNAFYPMEYTLESIIDVVVNGEEYHYQNIKYDAESQYYYVLDNKLGIYPTPSEDVVDGITVFHYIEPSELSASILSSVPDLDLAWHMLLVYHACREIAAISRDSDMVNVYVGEINELERQYRRSKQARPHQIQDVYGVGRGAL